MSTTELLTLYDSDPRKVDAIVAEHLFDIGITDPQYMAESMWYASTWEGMRLVVEKMRENGFGFGIDNLQDDGTWEASVYTMDRFMVGVAEARADTAPLAVALAALKAKGVVTDG